MMAQAFDQAKTRGPYDDYPVLSAGIDPQLCLSRNDRPQPFYLICQKDCVLVQMSGKARIRFQGSSVNYFDAVPGDHIYVPAGTPHRIEPAGEVIQYRIKAEHSGLEAVEWYCERCNSDLWRFTWDTAETLPQEGYLRACEKFNDDKERRHCRVCDHDHKAIDLSGYRWREVAEELRAPAEATEAW
jgi:3-hydroxyanthranilate 3,4-dioxygenase